MTLCADLVCHWPLICHRPRAHLQILFPEAQIQSHKLLSGRCVCGPGWLANCWCRSGDLRLLSLIQVIVNVEPFHLFPKKIHRIIMAPHALCVSQRVLPSGGGLHSTGACPGLFAQLTWNQRSEYIIFNPPGDDFALCYAQPTFPLFASILFVFFFL